MSKGIASAVMFGLAMFTGSALTQALFLRKSWPDSLLIGAAWGISGFISALAIPVFRKMKQEKTQDKGV